MRGSDPNVRGRPLLEVSGVGKRFPGVVALDDVSFSLSAGEVHALIGENGAGKSTLIKVITGVYQPDGGTVLLDGEPRQFRSPLEAQQAGVSTIYQEVNLVPLMSVARNLFLGREPRRGGVIDVRRMNREATRVLREVGLDVDVTRELRTLGLGAQQMVAIARAVQINARVVIMDEPTSSLEAREVATLFGVIGRLRQQGIGIVYVSHRLDELYAVCDRVTVMRDGKVVHTGPLAELPRLRLVSLMLGRELAESRRQVAMDTASRPPSSEPILRAVGLSRRNQLHDIDLEVQAGEVVGLGGLLGSGRSETAKAIVGALHTDHGEVYVGGRRLRGRGTAEAIRAGAVMLPEDRKAEGIVPSLSVRENIVLAALPRLSRAGLVSDAKQDEVVSFFMDRLKIKASSPDQRVSDLSGGNQQKVLLARWLCLNPRLLVLDEPTRGIDVGAKAEVQSLIDELAKDDLGVLLISSELEELISGSHRIVALKDGRVVGHLAGSAVTEDRLLQLLAGGSVEEAAAQAGLDTALLDAADAEYARVADDVTDPGGER